MIMKLLPFYCLARAFPTQVTIELDAGMKRLGYLLAVVFRSKWYHLWWDRALNYHCNDQLQYLTQLQGLSMWLVWLGLQLPSIQVHLNLHKDNNKYSPKSLLWYTSTYFSQRRAHSFSGFANFDSTPLLLGGTGVYHSPQSHYCSWSWNWVYLFSCGLGWTPLNLTPFEIY